MGNREHQTEIIVAKIAAFSRRQIENASADGHIDAQERAEIDETRAILDFAKEMNERRMLADYLERGGDPNAYCNRMAARIGMEITPINDRGRVVPFPHGRGNHG